MTTCVGCVRGPTCSAWSSTTRSGHESRNDLIDLYHPVSKHTDATIDALDYHHRVALYAPAEIAVGRSEPQMHGCAGPA